jgi:outer membrane protein with beta-barrel domain
MLRMHSTAVLVAMVLVPSVATGRVSMVGLKGGLSASTLHGDVPADPKNERRLGFSGGAFITVGVNRLVSVQPEILFVTKGTSLGTVDLTDQNGTVVGTADLVMKLDYLEFPVLVRLALPAMGDASPYVVAGPAVGVRLSQKLTLSGFGSSESHVANSADLGVALGAGITMGRGHIRGSFETRYTLGITRASEDSFSTNARNGDLMITAGIGLQQ